MDTKAEYMRKFKQFLPAGSGIVNRHYQYPNWAGLGTARLGRLYLWVLGCTIAL
jgi:hypothetical protein